MEESGQNSGGKIQEDSEFERLMNSRHLEVKWKRWRAVGRGPCGVEGWAVLNAGGKEPVEKEDEKGNKNKNVSKAGGGGGAVNLTQEGELFLHWGRRARNRWI